MPSERRLAFASVFFAVFWTLGMVAWHWPLPVAGVVVFALAGALAGVLWHWMMGAFFRRMSRSR
jgi:hypothetical protein